MSIRKLFGILIGLALVAAPSAALAAEPAMVSNPNMQMADMGHCDAPPSNGAHKAGGKARCMSMCIAVAITHEPAAADVATVQVRSYFTVARAWRGFLGEIATPPPRSA